MNTLEQGAQTIVLTLLNDLKIYQAKLQAFASTGKGVPSEIAKIVLEIEKILSYLKPFLTTIDAIIPASMPELKLVLDWALKIIDTMPS
jgi:hypothetical protein